MKIGDGSTFIIAEVGSCWSSFEQVKDSIQLAKNCGADAVKFQLFSPKELYGFDDDFVSGESPYFHHGWLPGLKHKADAVGIELMVSAFSPDGLEAVNPYVNIHKLASSENNHVRMLEKLNSYGKPVLLSTGGSSDFDVKRSMAYLKDVKTIPLYCVSDYPARLVDLDQMEKYRGMDFGFSDHSTDVLVIPKKAVDMGAKVIEKHVNFFDVQCADSKHSLSKIEFAKMVNKIRGVPVSGSGQKEMIIRHNRRLIAIKDIKIGDKFVENDNFGIFRSRKDDVVAVSPFNVERVNGNLSQQNISKGSGIGPMAVPKVR